MVIDPADGGPIVAFRGGVYKWVSGTQWVDLLPANDEGFGIWGGLSISIAASTVSGNVYMALSDTNAGEGESENERWSDRGWRFRSIWIAVLAIGIGFGLAGVRPIPAIVLAQALNGVLLPLVAVFLLLTVNDRALMGERGLNGAWANSLLAIVVSVTVMLGVVNVAKALNAAFGFFAPGESRLVLWSIGLSLAGAIPVWKRVRRLRGAPAGGAVG